MDTSIKCSICLDSINESFYKQKCCSNYFHHNCLKEWFKYKSICPLCRSEPTILTYKEYLEIKYSFQKNNGLEYLDILNKYLLLYCFTKKKNKGIIYNFILFIKLVNHLLC
jgi:hypothetical protein